MMFIPCLFMVQNCFNNSLEFNNIWPLLETAIELRPNCGMLLIYKYAAPLVTYGRYKQVP